MKDQKETSSIFSLSLNLSRANVKPEARSSTTHAISTTTNNNKHNAEVIPAKRRKRLKCDDLVRSLDRAIPIPKFDFELQQLERDFFGESDDDDDNDARPNSRPKVTKEQLQKLPLASSETATRGREQAEAKCLAAETMPVGAGGDTSDLEGNRNETSASQKRSNRQSSVAAAVGSLSSMPSSAELLVAIKYFLNKSDPNSATANDCFQAIEQQFAVSLAKREKIWIREQLKKLMLEQQVSATSTKRPENKHVAAPGQEVSKTVDAKQPSLTLDLPSADAAPAVALQQPSLPLPNTKTLLVSSSDSQPCIARAEPSSSGTEKQDKTNVSNVARAPKPSRRTATKPQRQRTSALAANRKVVADKNRGAEATSWPSKESIEIEEQHHPPMTNVTTASSDHSGVANHMTSESHKTVGNMSKGSNSVAAGALKGNPTILLDDDDDASNQDNILFEPKSFVSAPQLPKGRKRKAAVRNNDNEKQPAAKRGQKRSHSRCHMCSHCPCTFANVFETKPATVPNVAQSDDALERALLRQLQTMEKNAEKYEDQIDNLRRRLKKQRKEMWLKMKHDEAENNKSNLPTESRFLPDTSEMDQLLYNGRPSSRLPKSTVKKSKQALFSFAPTFQPTLTQMLGRSSSTKNVVGSTAIAGLEMIAEGKNENGEASASEHVESDDCSVNNMQQSSDDEKDLMADEEWEVGSVTVEVQRLEDGKGSTDMPQSARIIDANESGYLCQWDALFDDSDGLVDLDQLCDMLDGHDTGHETCQTLGEELELMTRIEPPMLSQQGRQIMDGIVENVLADPIKLVTLENACPDWKENICFALKHRNVADLNEALGSIHTAKTKLQRTRNAILKTAENRANVLELYELALVQSIARFQPQLDVGGQAGEVELDHEGFFADNSKPAEQDIQCNPSGSDEDDSFASGNDVAVNAVLLSVTTEQYQSPSNSTNGERTGPIDEVL